MREPCQAHEVEAQHPNPQQLVAAGQRRAGEIVEALGAGLAAIPLPIGLSVVAPVPDHRVTAATGAAHALRPAALAHQGEALGVVHQAREVDQVGCSHGGGDSLHERGQLSPLAPADQASFAPRPGPNLTTPKPDKSVRNYLFFASWPGLDPTISSDPRVKPGMTCMGLERNECVTGW